MPTLQQIEASSLGRIRYVGPKRRKIDTGHVFPQSNGTGGYRQSGVLIAQSDGRAVYKALRVHRLVALAFHGLPPLSDERIVVGHLDDDPGNNRSDNLRWMTQAENCNAPGCIAKLRAREARRGEEHPFFGRQHSPETRAKMSASRRGENHPMFGRQHSPETRAKMSAALREAAARRRLQSVPTPEAGSASHA